METAEVCQAVVVAEDSSTQISAMELCDRLLKQLGDELQFNFHSCRFKELSDPHHARAAAQAVARADILLVATHGDDLPASVRSWLESCYELRTVSVGALALLFVEPISASAAVSDLVGRLQAAAGRLRMDFLPLVPQPAEPIRKALQGGSGSMNPLLKGILNRPPPDHWGINE
jgi:hypothetical protein